MEVVLKMSDFHIPFHDERAIETALQLARHVKPKILVLDEIVDFYSISKYNKDPNRKTALQTDLDTSVGLLSEIRRSLPNTRIVMVESNHDKRLTYYLNSKSEEFKNLRCLKIQSLLNLSELKIEYRRDFVFRGVLFKHGEHVRPDSSYTAKAEYLREGMSGASGHCFSEDTEVLTYDGWKRFDSIAVGDSVLTYNLKTESSEWNDIKDVFHYDDYTELIHFKNKVIDLLVTPEHAIIGSTRFDKNNFKRKDAKDCVGKRIDMLCGGKNTQPEVPFSDNFLKLCAWIITEGNYGKSSIRISQSEKPKVGIKHITDICDNLNVEYSVVKRYDKKTKKHNQYRNYDAYRINLHQCDVVKHIRKIFPDKQLNSFLYTLSARQFLMFFNEIILGDGCKNKEAKRSFQYASKHEKEIDVLQGICAFNGFRCSKIKRKRNNTVYYILTINTRGVSSVERGGKIVKHTGRVWCVTVDNQTLFVRRNGKNVISGNTHRLGMYFRTVRGGKYVWLEGGCLCTTTDVEYIEGTANWQQGVCMFMFEDGKKSFQPKVVPIIDYKVLWGNHVFRG